MKLRQYEIEQRLSGHTTADENFHYTLSVLVELTARAHECFTRANVEQKRKLLTLIFANLEMQGSTLCYTLQKPFDVLAKLPESKEWQGRQPSYSRFFYSIAFQIREYYTYIINGLLSSAFHTIPLTSA